MMNEKPRTETPWNIEVRQSSIHGSGVFATQSIPAGMRVIEYVGEQITKAESLLRCEQGNEYIFHMDDQYDLDGSVAWNPARFINHSCAPNCEAVMEDGRIFIVSTMDIPAGGELAFDYGYDLQDYREHPCRCGSANCAGYIVAGEFHQHLRRRNADLSDPAESIGL